MNENMEFYTTAEVAETLGVSQETVRRLVERGELASYRIGRVLRFRRSDIEAFLARCRGDERKE